MTAAECSRYFEPCSLWVLRVLWILPRYTYLAACVFVPVCGCVGLCRSVSLSLPLSLPLSLFLSTPSSQTHTHTHTNAKHKDYLGAVDPDASIVMDPKKFLADDDLSANGYVYTHNNL